MQFLHTLHCVIFGNFYNKHWNCCLFCLFSLIFKKNMMLVIYLIPILKQQFIEFINGRSQRSECQKSNLLLFWRHDWLKNFHSNLLKIDKKSHKDIDIYYIGYITIKKFSDCENIHSVNPLYLIIHSATGYFKEKTVKNT